jgi:serine/threonine protein kinase
MGYLGNSPALARLVFPLPPEYNMAVECIQCLAEIPHGGESCPKCGWLVPADRLKFARLNKIFSDRYDFLRLLGVGGFAEVYLARDVLLEREVAIKILLPQHAQDAQTVERFLREARLYAKLEHKNIIPIYDTGILQQHVFITMKYIRGESLKHVLARQKRIAPQHLPGIVRGMAQALSYIHQQGIVHRDIKPANILVEKKSQAAYLADFGIARTESSQTLTQTGMIVGTPHYLSPEQIQGKKIDQRSDIYALGATLYELATGQPPFKGDSPLEILYQHINENAEPLTRLVPDIDPVMERIISKCIAKDPVRRFQRAEEILALLEGAESPRPAFYEKTVLTPAGPAKPGKTMKILALTALLSGLAFAGYFLWIKNILQPPSSSAKETAIAEKLEPGKKEKPDFVISEKQSSFPDRKAADPPSRSQEVIAQDQAERNPGSHEIQPRQKPEAKVVPAADTGMATAKAPGTIRFSSFPPLADVYLNGEKIGSTEQVFEKKFPAGDYVFSFSIPGYRSAEVWVAVKAGETVGAHNRFPPFRNFTITASPFGKILIDGKEYGDTPQTVKLAYGEHLVQVVKNGYQIEEKKIAFDQNAKNSIFFELKKEEKK